MNVSPLSMSHSGEEAPLHSLRGPRIGEIRPKSDRETVQGSSRLHGSDEREGEEDEDVNDGEKEEEKGNCRCKGLLPPEFKLHVKRVSKSSSDMALLLQFSSSNVSDATRVRQDEGCFIVSFHLVLAETYSYTMVKHTSHLSNSIVP